MRAFPCRAAATAAMALLATKAAHAAPAAGHYPYFPPDAPWTQDVSQAPVDAESPAVISWLQAQGGSNGLGGWGGGDATGGHVQIDFSIEVLEADAATPFRTFTPTDNFFTPDCDDVPMPVPAGGALEGETGYACSGGDCHLLVVDRAHQKLYEMWTADIDPITDVFSGGCLAVWNLALTYPPEARGNDCTSADAAGFPIAPLLFSADEVAAGSIDHAIRFILPNKRMRAQVYVHPATHSTGQTSGPPTAPPYGARLRLRGDYPLGTLPSEAARIVARALQKYGMLLADGGNIALTAQSDQFTTNKWDAVGLGANDLAALKVSDFEMVAAGPRFTYTGDCTRTDPLFYDGFEAPLAVKWLGGKTP